MPIPKPKNEEKEQDFIERCMGDDTMKEDYPDNDQRLAVCFDSWKKEKKETKTEEEDVVEDTETESVTEETLNTMPANVERRCLVAEELRVIEDDGSPKIIGYPVVFNKYSEPMMGFREKVAPGALKKALKTSDPRGLFNHDINIVLGRQSAGTLKLREDDKGLFMELTPPDTQFVRDVVLTPIKRKDIKEMSFAFTVAKEEWHEDKEKNVVTRTLVEIERLFDVSPVTFPAYPDTSVALRSLEEWRKEQEVSEPKPIEGTLEGWEDITSADADKVQEDLRNLRTRARKIEVSKL